MQEHHSGAGTRIAIDCVWSEDWEGYWETECGNEFVFSAEGPLENGFNHCPYCGRDLREKPYKEEADGNDSE